MSRLVSYHKTARRIVYITVVIRGGGGEFDMRHFDTGPIEIKIEFYETKTIKMQLRAEFQRNFVL